MWNLKKGTDELIYKIEIENIDKTNLWLLEGKGEGINWETGIDMYTPLYIKQVINKDLLDTTGNSTQYSIMAYMGKESKEKWPYA